MKVLQINTTFQQGSTGKICKGILDQCEAVGIKSYIAYARAPRGQKLEENEITVSSWWNHHIHNRLARMFMSTGAFSFFHTKRFLRKIKQNKPDIIHLHNIHANFINLKLLFHFIKKEKIAIVWTLHDCWAFTGYCTHYSAVHCEKWKSLCSNCPNRYLDPVTLIDRSKAMYRKKKKMFCGIEKMKLVTPSNWLKQEVLNSFLQNYPVQVINNGIDLGLFTPTDSNFREKYQINKEQFIVLGVAHAWGARKGLDAFLELSKRLDKSFKIVLVGTTDEIDQHLPDTIISIHRTQNQKELAEIYSASDLFVNPTIEDNFPTVNIEAIACGTPVLTYETGGSAEIIDNTCGCVVSQGNIEALEKEIIRIRDNRPYSQNSCLQRAQKYDMQLKFAEYIDLYKEILRDRATTS